MDLVEGEFMQLGSKEKEDERFNHYLKKTFNKTASLIAFSCKAVSFSLLLSRRKNARFFFSFGSPRKNYFFLNTLSNFFLRESNFDFGLG